MTTPVTLDIVHQINNPKTRRTKVVCTLGPACWSVEGLVDLIDGGMNVARFNFSHGDHATHSACLARLREAISLRPYSHVAIMLGMMSFTIVESILSHPVLYIRYERT